MLQFVTKYIPLLHALEADPYIMTGFNFTFLGYLTYQTYS